MNSFTVSFSVALLEQHFGTCLTAEVHVYDPEGPTLELRFTPNVNSVPLLTQPPSTILDSDVHRSLSEQQRLQYDKEVNDFMAQKVALALLVASNART